MKCKKIKLLVYDYLHNHAVKQKSKVTSNVDEPTESWSDNRETIDLHLQSCDSCQRYYQQCNELNASLQAIPRPKASIELKQRVLSDRAARQQHSNTSQIQPPQNKFYLGMAASVCLLIITALLTNIPTKEQLVQTPVATASPIPQSSISALMGKPSQINFLVNSTQIINNVTFSVSVPPQMALYGYAGRQTLSWNGMLKQGKNLLTIPVVALTERPGILIMKITHMDSIKEFRVTVDVRQNLGLARDPGHGQFS